MSKKKGKGLFFGFLNFKPFEGEGDGEGEKGSKKEEKRTFKTVEEAQAYIEGLEKEKRVLLHETMDRKEKLRKLETEKTEAEQRQLAEQGKYKELSESMTPKVKRLEQLEPVLNEIYDLEIADIPEDKRDLIPNGNIEEKLKWVKQAKAKNLFGTAKEEPKKKLPPGSEGGKPNQDGSLPEFTGWTADDPRLTSLSTDQYLVWKKHNRAVKTGVKGWGGV